MGKLWNLGDRDLRKSSCMKQVWLLDFCAPGFLFDSCFNCWFCHL